MATLDDKAAAHNQRIVGGLMGLNGQNAAAALMRSKEWKAAVKELKRRKMNTAENRSAMLTAWLNRSGR